MIVDNFNTNSLISIESYLSGVDGIKNTLYKSESIGNGFISFDLGSIDPITPFHVYIRRGLTEPTTVLTYTGVVNVANLAATINKDKTALELGISANLRGTTIYIRVDNSAWSEYSIYLGGYFYKTRVTIDALHPQVKFNALSPYYAYYNVLNISTIQSNVFNSGSVSDPTSILKYGIKQLAIGRLDGFKDKEEVLTILTNKLNTTKDPKVRMVIHVPFNYQNVDLLNVVEVRLAYQNVDKVWSFVEGGVYLSWVDHPDGYRTKTFLVTGIRHAQDGSYTSLTLMETTPVVTPNIIEEVDDMAIGAIIAYAGTTAPENYLLCNGSSVSRTIYSSLYAVIGNSYGSADANSFNVPDLRGRFLRGMDGGIGRDPDAVSRTAMNTGGNTGDNVGSVQADGFKAHIHTIAFKNADGGDNTRARRAAGDDDTGYYESESTGGNETRPINAYVTYIIKYQ